MNEMLTRPVSFSSASSPPSHPQAARRAILRPSSAAVFFPAVAGMSITETQFVGISSRREGLACRCFHPPGAFSLSGAFTPWVCVLSPVAGDSRGVCALSSDEVHRIAGAEIVDTCGLQCPDRQGAAHRCEGEDVRQHSAEGECLRWLACRVQESVLTFACCDTVRNDGPNRGAAWPRRARSAAGEVWPAGMLVAPSTALTHISSWRTSFSQTARRLGRASMPSTGSSIGWSRTSAGSPVSRSIWRRSAQRDGHTSCQDVHGSLLCVAGSRRPPGG